ncbi:iron ABC transporter substrate-binding protein [Nocardiopsis terrae]|uniref:Iron complex transport system substrate-binding protein n=1 Tax=Nocardiopsis terrae TaxID=372655 RepID=A0ABR9HD86_9ACTN|nr:ABC transporter substrate-binding protein [Nocardiopsis terrae]MBE1456851.1 iron complex transport system substrate-binding protein [Nocardiopsis terrae]GHC74793.1 iron ABC transporter substrate-binding protein [Nocardiopsis terrae]
MSPGSAPRALACAVLLLLPLTACGAAEGDPPGAGSAPQAEEGAFPVTIEHEFGSTTVEEEPERVVTLGVTDADAVLALGVVPVGNTGYVFYESGLGPWTDELVKGSELTRIDSDSEPNIEQIANLAPDLIIGISAGFDGKVYENLSRIAPVIARPAGSAAYTVPREEATEVIATALGRPEEGAELNEATDELLERTRAEYPGFAGLTGTAVLPYDGRYGAYLPGDARGRFLLSLGFEVPEAIAERDDGDDFFVELSTERVDLLDGDLLLVMSEDEDFDITEGASVFDTLDVVREDAVVTTTLDERGAVTYNSVLSVPYALDHLVPRIDDALSQG